MGAVATWLHKTLVREDAALPPSSNKGNASATYGGVAASSTTGGTAASSAPHFMKLRSRFRQWALGDDPLSSLVLPEDFLNTKICFKGLPHHLANRPSSTYSGGAALTPPPPSGGTATSAAATTAAVATPAASAAAAMSGAAAAPLRSEAVSSDALVAVDPAPFTVSEATPLSRVHYLFAVCLFPELLCVSTEGRFSGCILKNDLASNKRLHQQHHLGPSPSSSSSSQTLSSSGSSAAVAMASSSATAMVTADLSLPSPQATAATAGRRTISLDGDSASASAASTKAALSRSLAHDDDDEEGRFGDER